MNENVEDQGGGAALPAWYARDLLEPFGAGIASVFLLHGDIHGLFVNPDAADEPDRPYLTLPAFLEKVLDGGAIVAFYDVASGLKLLRPAMEAALMKLASRDETRSDPGDPIAAARAGLAAKRGIPREPDPCLSLVEKALRAMKGVAVVIESAHFVAPTISAGIPLPPNERVTIQRIRNWAHDDAIRSRRNMVILVTDQAAKVSGELRLADCGVALIRLPKPSEEERLAFLRASAASDTLEDGFGIEELALASQGLSLRQIQDVLLRTREAGEPLQLERVKEKKREILNVEYGDVMDLVEPARGLDDIGGHAHIKKYFAEVLESIRKGETRLVPMGVTLMGPPGTGKTAIVEALAKEAGFNFIKIRNVRSMWVGESEARMEKLVYGLRSLAPVVVMNDEADLADGGRDAPRGDSGVSERLMKMWMELLSDPRIRGRIIVIHCTNRPDRIDPALKRSGRSDERILMPMPSLDERSAILEVQFRRHSIPTSIRDFTPFARKTEGLSGADLEKICLGAYRVARERSKAEVEDQALAAAIADFIPNASQAEIDVMTVAGLAECSSRRLLPANVAELVAGISERGLVPNLEAILAGLAERGIVSPFIREIGAEDN